MTTPLRPPAGPGQDGGLRSPEVGGVSEIDRCIQTALHEKTCSAAACIASVGGKVFHRAVYGTLAEPRPSRKVDLDTVFDLGSLSRPLGAGLAAMWLTAHGRLDLGARLPAAVAELKGGRFDGVTIDMLLDHTSGLPPGRALWREAQQADGRRRPGERRFGTRAAAADFKRAAAGLRFEAEPGTKTNPSDVGFLALGWALEAIAEQPLDLLLEREIYRPLGIADDLFFVRLDDPERRRSLARRVFAASEVCSWREKLIQGEVSDANAWGLGGVAGHAGLFGTVEAVWRLAQALWEAHAGASRFFHGGTLQRFWTRSRRLPGTSRALGWDTPTVNQSAAGKRWSHAAVGEVGSLGGAVWIDLARGVIGVLLANAAHPTREGKTAALQKLHPRLFELIAKHGETLEPGDDARGTRSFHAGSVHGPGVRGRNPPGGPRR